MIITVVFLAADALVRVRMNCFFTLAAHCVVDERFLSQLVEHVTRIRLENTYSMIPELEFSK